MFRKSAVLASLLVVMPFSLAAEEVTGKIQSIIHSSKVIQYLNPKTKAVQVIKYTDETKLEAADSFKDLTVNTKFKATLNEDKIATKIKRVLVKLPDDQVIDTDTLSEMLDEGKTVFIGDARPKGKYDIGHIPTSKATPSDKLEKNLNWLPKDKDTLLVFYCGGVTCPLSPNALKIAMANGYTNVKAYVEGFPAWKAEVYPSHVNKEWLKDNLDVNHVILDVRENPVAHIKGAVHMPVEKLVQLHEKWNKEKLATGKRTIFGLRDKKAPIAIIADSADADEAIEAYEILSFWKFANVAILDGGMDQWIAAKLPVGKGDISTQLTYVKKPVKGAVEIEDFVKIALNGGGTIIDVRNPDEVAQGKLKDSINIPLNQLDKHLSDIPKDQPVVLHCAAGARASLGYILLTKKGFTNVKFLNDTFNAVAKENNLKLL